MMKATQAAARRLSPIVLSIAQSLGEPMLYKRQQVLPVSARRRIQLWEFQALGNAGVTKVIAVDIRDHRIRDWKLLSDGFEQAVQEYRQRIEERRRDRQTRPTPAAAA